MDAILLAEQKGATLPRALTSLSQGAYEVVPHVRLETHQQAAADECPYNFSN